MTRSGIYALIGTLFFSAPLAALESKNINPRDPSIWQEKHDPAATGEVACNIFSSSVCPSYEDDKSEQQREYERREQRRNVAEREKMLKAL